MSWSWSSAPLLCLVFLAQSIASRLLSGKILLAAVFLLVVIKQPEKASEKGNRQGIDEGRKGWRWKRSWRGVVQLFGQSEQLRQ